MRLYAAVLAALLALPLAAQTPATRKRAPAKAPKKTAAAPADRWPLSAIRIAGNSVFPTDAILRVTGLHPGDSVSKQDLERALNRITDTGAFEAVSYNYVPDGQRIAVTFEVQEGVELFPVVFERLDAPDAELMKALAERVPLFGPQVPGSGAMVQRIVAALQDYLAQKGKPSDVVGRVANTTSGKLVMTFRPTAAAPSVTFVRFENSTSIPAEDLQRAFYHTAVGLPYNEERFRLLLDTTIRPLFEQKGKLGLKFGAIKVEDSKDATGVELTVPIEEGEDYQFGTVRFTGNAHVSEKELARQTKIEPGVLANFGLINKLVEDVERRYRRDGYMHAKTAVDRKLDDAKKVVDLTIRVEEGDTFTMRELTIKGLDIHGEDALRRRWAIQRGQPFDGAYPENFLRRIEEEGMFDQLGKTSSRINVDEAAKMVDVELTFAAAPADPNAQRRRRRQPF